MTHQEFVSAFIELKDIRAVARRLGIDSHTVSNVATMLRSKGVRLPKLSRNRIEGQKRLTDRCDVQALNQLIERNGCHAAD